MLAYKAVSMGMSTTLARAMSDPNAAVAAAGTTQATATATDDAVVYVNSGSGGVALSINGFGGDSQVIYNALSSSIKVYPPVGKSAQINGLGNNNPMILAPSTGCMFSWVSLTQIVANLSA